MREKEQNEWSRARFVGYFREPRLVAWSAQQVSKQHAPRHLGYASGQRVSRIREAKAALHLPVLDDSGDGERVALVGIYLPADTVQGVEAHGDRMTATRCTSSTSAIVVGVGGVVVRPGGGVLALVPHDHRLMRMMHAAGISAATARLFCVLGDAVLMMRARGAARLTARKESISVFDTAEREGGELKFV